VAEIRAVMTALRGIAVLLLFAAALAAHGDLHERITVLSAAIAADPGNAQLLLERAELYRQHGEWDLALSDVVAAEQRADAGACALLHGRILIDAGRMHEAVPMLDRFLTASPTHAEAHLLRARAQEALGDHRAAAEDFRLAIAVLAQPEPEHYLGWARALADDGQMDAAVQALDTGMAKLGPVLSLADTAVAYEQRLGRHAAALARIEALRPHLPRAELYLLRRARALEGAGRSPEAHTDYAAAAAALATLPEGRQATALVQQLREAIDAGLLRTQPPVDAAR
jgi:tetratricopeptide (TPR) repeat protein